MNIYNRTIKIEIPTRARQVLDSIRGAGFEAFVVGGCVRDSVMGKDRKSVV